MLLFVFHQLKDGRSGFRLWSMELILYPEDQEEETVGLSGRAILTVADVLLIEISAESFNAL